MRRIGQQFINVVSPERSVAVANYDQFVASRNRLLEATIDVVAVSLLRLVYCGRAGLARALQRIVAAVVADNDYLIDQGVGLEIKTRVPNTSLFVIGGERYDDAEFGDRIVSHTRQQQSFISKKHQKTN